MSDERIKKAAARWKMDEIAKALSQIAAAIDRQAEATVLLARATAGEFDEPDETIDPDAARLPDGYRGMR